MRSDSLIRLHVEHPGRDFANEEARVRILQETEEFLARGGRIQEIPTSQGSDARFIFNMGDGKNNSSPTRPDHVPEREIVDGETMINRRLVALRVGIAQNTIDRYVKEREFPRPRKNGRSARWAQSEVDAWVIDQGDNFKPRRPRG